MTGEDIVGVRVRDRSNASKSNVKQSRVYCYFTSAHPLQAYKEDSKRKQVVTVKSVLQPSK